MNRRSLLSFLILLGSLFAQVAAAEAPDNQLPSSQVSHGSSQSQSMAGVPHQSASPKRQTLEELKVGAGSLQFGDSLVTRVAEDSFIVFPLNGHEAVTATNFTEVQKLIEAQKEATLGADGKVRGTTISEILETARALGEKDFTDLNVPSLAEASRSPESLKKLVVGLVNTEEKFSSRINDLLHSELAKGLSDATKQFLSGLFFGDRSRTLKEKIAPLMKSLDASNTNTDPRIGNLKQVFMGKGGFLDAFQKEYREAQASQTAKANASTAFNDVGCPACAIAGKLETGLPALAGMGRKQVPRGEAIHTNDGQTFFKGGKSYVVRNRNGSIEVIDPEGKTHSSNLDANPVFKALLAARIDNLNSPKPKTVAAPQPLVVDTAPSAAAPRAPWTTNLALPVTIPNVEASQHYPEELNSALAKPTPREAARGLFRLGPFYREKGALVDAFLDDARFNDEKAKGLLKEFLENTVSKYRHCPSCWLGDRFQWNPHH